MIESESPNQMRTRNLPRKKSYSVRFGDFNSVMLRCSFAYLPFLLLLGCLTERASSQAVNESTSSQPAVAKLPATGPAAAAEAPRGSVDIRVERTVVLINVTVTDPLNRFVTGLEKEHFRLFEDKVEQEISQFSAEDAPISIGLVFDTSGSMGAKLQKSRQAAAELFKTANPSDEFFLVQFNDRPELVVPFTTDTDRIQSALTFTQSRGRTALLDSVYLAMHEMKKAHNPRKALLIISDGGDNSSRYTETEIKNAVKEADVQIFAIGIFESMGNRGRTPEEASGPSC